MKAFFERYSYDSVRMLLDQAAISLFGFSLAMATTKLGNDTLLMVTSLGAILFYLLLIYGAAKKVGTHDKSTVDLGRRTFKPFTGTLVSLLANTPNLILAAIITIINFASEDGGSGVPRAIALLLNGMYQGLLATIRVGGTDEAPVWLNSCWWVFWLLVLPALLVSTIGYIAGVKDWHLTGLSTPELPVSDRPTRKEKKEAREEKKNTGK